MKVVVDLSAPVERLPLAVTAPIVGAIVQLAALLADQLSVAAALYATDVGEAVKDAMLVGGVAAGVLPPPAGLDVDVAGLPDVELGAPGLTTLPPSVLGVGPETGVVVSVLLFDAAPGRLRDPTVCSVVLVCISGLLWLIFSSTESGANSPTNKMRNMPPMLVMIATKIIFFNLMTLKTPPYVCDYYQCLLPEAGRVRPSSWVAGHR